MKRPLLLTALIILFGVGGMNAAVADRGRVRSHVGVGVTFGPYWGPWYYPPPYYYPPYYPPVIIERPAPPVYIEQSPPVEVRPQTSYWYYCQSPSGYYPDVRECPGGWLKVLPRP